MRIYKTLMNKTFITLMKLLKVTFVRLLIRY